MNDRDIQFVNYYCLSVYTMRISKYCLEMSKSYCAKPKIKHTLGLAEKAMDARIADVMLLLKSETKNELLEDLASDDLQALGNILHNIISLVDISDVEDPLLNFIRELKKIQSEKQLEESITG